MYTYAVRLDTRCITIGEWHVDADVSIGHTTLLVSRELPYAIRCEGSSMSEVTGQVKRHVGLH